ncbi:MAG: hypothetical protein ACYCOU_00880 [Sulfobacillus sp.]
MDVRPAYNEVINRYYEFLSVNMGVPSKVAWEVAKERAPLPPIRPTAEELRKYLCSSWPCLPDKASLYCL